MLQKVDRNVAYVVMVVHILQAFVSNVLSVFSRRTLQVCLFGCCICSTHMLQIFYLDVAYVLQWF